MYWTFLRTLPCQASYIKLAGKWRPGEMGGATHYFQRLGSWWRPMKRGVTLAKCPRNALSSLPVTFYSSLKQQPSKLKAQPEAYQSDPSPPVPPLSPHFLSGNRDAQFLLYSQPLLRFFWAPLSPIWASLGRVLVCPSYFAYFCSPISPVILSYC